MVVLLDHVNGEFCLRPQAAQKLAGLGVTSVAVVGNQPATSPASHKPSHGSAVRCCKRPGKAPGPRMRTR